MRCPVWDVIDDGSHVIFELGAGEEPVQLKGNFEGTSIQAEEALTTNMSP
jgi:hypothetical protein